MKKKRGAFPPKMENTKEERIKNVLTKIGLVTMTQDGSWAKISIQDLCLAISLLLEKNEAIAKEFKELKE